MIRIRKKRKGYSYVRDGKKIIVFPHIVTYKIKKKKRYNRGNPYGLKKVNIFHTRYIQDKRTGLMKGRKRVQGIGERVGVRVDPATGRIFGRFKKIKKRQKK